MDNYAWLQPGTILSDNSKIIKLLCGGETWQIFSANFENYVLVVSSGLLNKWIEAGLVAGRLFEDAPNLDNDHFYFSGRHSDVISFIPKGPYPNTTIEAQAFVLALKETRKIITNISLHDAIYIEQISRLLPTYSLTEASDDKTTLGTWLAGGVRISTDSFRRLSKLVGWMDSRTLTNLIANAGFDLQSGANLAQQMPAEEKQDSYNVVEPNTIKSNGFDSGEKFKLPGRSFLEEFINENIVDIIANEDRYRAMGIGFPSAVVLYGPPGCGKTYAVEKLVEYLGWPCYSIDSSSIASPYIHDTSKKIAELFDQAIENAPSVIVIDEMEAFLSDRGSFNAGLHHVEEVAEFLRRIPEAINNRVLVIAMTNMIDQIDQAILRRGRFDHIIAIEFPSKEEVANLLHTLLSPLPTTEDIDISFMANKLAGKPLSDVAYTVREAGRIAVKNEKTEIDLECLKAALENIKCGVDENKRKIGFY